MPSPSSSLATLRPDLAGSFMEFDLDMQARGLIAVRVLPVLEVAKQAGKFGLIPIEQLLQARITDRAPGSGYSRGKFTFKDSSYATGEHGTEEPVDDREAQMYRDYFDAEMVAASRAREVVMRNAEQRAQDLIFNTTTWTGASLTTAVVNEWDDAANADPIIDIEKAIQKVYDNSGLRANALVIGWKVFRNLRHVDKVIDRIKYQGFQDVRPNQIGEQALAQALGIDQVIVGGMVKNTANEGAAASLSMMWSGEYAMVCRVAESQDIREPCIGRTFHWGEDGSEVGGLVESYRDETVRSDIIRVRHDVDELVLYVEAGHLLSNITT